MKRSTHRWKRLARLGILDVKYSDTTLLYEIVHFILEDYSSPFIQPELVNSMTIFHSSESELKYSWNRGFSLY